MTLHIYNTLSRKKELFKPIKDGRVRMYVCGVTVYDSCHIGHARSMVFFDVTVRYLGAIGFDVTYIRNFTDVDDKIINRAGQLGIDSREVAEKYIKEFYEDMDALNVKRATVEPRATEHIDQIIKLIEDLIDKNFAYRIDGDVYFAVESFKEYGKLSGRRLEDMKAGSRVDIDKRKRNPFDFALWKSAKPGEPFWDSPWGRGRPGWHIECSAMSAEYLGETFDIHGGGKDLIFPHHENEIAQSEGASGKPFVKFWVHNDFVNINQEKMSKSLGNFLMIKNMIKLYYPEAVRLFLLSSHYRSPVELTEMALSEAVVNLDRLYALLERIEEKIGPPGPGLKTASNKTGGYLKQFYEAMDDDFNTPRGIATLFNAVRNINRLLDESRGNLSLEAEREVESGRSDILRMGDILGILAESPKAYFDKKRSYNLEKMSIDPNVVEKMVMERTEARRAKRWAEADRIRRELAEMNIIIEDKHEGTVWRVGRLKV